MSVFERVGDVQYVNEKGGYYSFKLDDEKWYGTGEINPPFKKGDRIKFSGTTNEKNGTTYYNVDLETVKVKAGKGVVKPYKKSGGGGKSTAESKAYWDKRMQMDLDRVTFEHEKHVAIGEYSVRNSAIAYLNILREVGALPIAKLKTAASIHKAMDACLDAIVEQFKGEAPKPAVESNVVALKQPEPEKEADDFDEPETDGGAGVTQGADDGEDW